MERLSAGIMTGMRKNNAIDLKSREIPHNVTAAPCCPTKNVRE
jgi:hypothetical protein